MTRPRPLFGTGTARTGANLVCRMLNVNEQVMVAPDPFLELFRSFRNAAVREGGGTLDPTSPLPDYYFSDQRIQLLDTILAADLELPFDPAETEHLLEVSLPRLELECADLVELLPDLPGPTYKAMFDNALDIVARGRGASGRKWVGLKEVWTIEFFAPLARAYPDARFFVIVRDPRASTASMLGIERTHPQQVVHPVSWLRHWRKYAAFTTHYRDDPLFADRLYVLRHEDLLERPEEEAAALCAFLEVEYDPRMVDTDNYVDPATGAVWAGNSSFEGVTKGMSTHRAERWRSALAPEVVELVEFVCAPEMRLGGYEPISAGAARLTPAALEYALGQSDGPFNWRTDFGDPQLDLGFECFRRSLLDLPGGPADSSIVRRSFLFEDVLEQLRSADAAVAPPAR